MRERLKPCPFCGSENLKLKQSLVHDANGRLTEEFFYRYECQYCGAQGGGWYTDREAAKKWNRRAEVKNDG